RTRPTATVNLVFFLFVCLTHIFVLFGRVSYSRASEFPNLIFGTGRAFWSVGLLALKLRTLALLEKRLGEPVEFGRDAEHTRWSESASSSSGSLPSLPSSREMVCSCTACLIASSSLEALKSVDR